MLFALCKARSTQNRIDQYDQMAILRLQAFKYEEFGITSSSCVYFF